MNRPHLHVSLLLAVLSVFVTGCGGFNGVLTPTLSSISPSTVAAGSAAFTLTATGTNFTSGTKILWDGVSLPTTVTSSTQLTANITADQIALAGSITIRAIKPDTTTSGALTLTVTGGTGPGGNTFTLTDISPTAVAAGSPSFTLTATGIGFASGAAITLNGTAIATTFDSATQLHGTVDATVVAAAGTVTVGVTNADKTTSNTKPLTVIAGGGLGPAPTLTSINPNTSVNGRTTDLTVTATGTGFVNGSTVMWNGMAMATTFVSSTQLTATIPAAQFNIPASFFDPATGTATEQVFVLNPDSTISNELPFTITISPSATPTLVTIFNPLKTQRSKVNDPAFTLTLCGSLFANGATAYFGTSALTTSAVAPAGADCKSQSPATNQPAQQVTAQVPASVLTAVAELPVTIQNPGPPAKASNSIPYYVGMNIYFDEVSDVVWDARLNLLYVSKPSTANHTPDTILAFSPKLGLNDVAAIWTLQLPSGSNPDRLALTPDGKTLYVGLDGSGTVQLLNITGGASKPTVGSSINLGSDPTDGPYYAMDMQLAPGSSSTIAIARGIPLSKKPLQVAQGGVAIYDGTTARANTVGPSSQPTPVLIDTIQWSADGTRIYGADNENASGNLYELAVSASGVTLAAADDHLGLFTVPNLYIHSDPATNLVYGDDGLVIDPATATVKTSFQVSGIMTVDSPGNTAYFVSHPPEDSNVLEYFVNSYNLATTATGASLDLYNVQGIPQHLIHWANASDGTSGLALTTQKFNCLFSPCTVGDGRLFVIDLPLP